MTTEQFANINPDDALVLADTIPVAYILACLLVGVVIISITFFVFHRRSKSSLSELRQLVTCRFRNVFRTLRSLSDLTANFVVYASF